MGQPEIVSRIFSVATPDLKSTESTIPNSGSGLCNSGSMTVARAALIASIVLIICLGQSLVSTLVLFRNHFYQLHRRYAF